MNPTLRADYVAFATRLRTFIHERISDSRHYEVSAANDREFNLFALELFRLQYHGVTLYRRLCDNAKKTPATVADWRQIPSVITSAFKEFELTCLPENERTHYFFSSGTTAQVRSRHFHNATSLKIYEASLLPWFAKHTGTAGGVKESQSKRTFLSLTPTAEAVPHSSLAHMFATIHREFGVPDSRFAGSVDADGNWQLDCASLVDELNRFIAKHQPVMLLGTAFNVVHLLDHLAERNLSLKLPADSSVMETGGYKGRSRELSKPELHAEITARLGVPNRRILCEYGMSELSSQGYDLTLDGENSANRQFKFPPWARALVISPETGLEVGDGQSGLIRIFDLANIYSLLAIQTEDLGVRRGEGFELAGRAAQAEVRGCSLQSV